MYGRRGVDKSSPSIVSIREWMEVFKLEEKEGGINQNNGEKRRSEEEDAEQKRGELKFHSHSD